MKLLIVDDSEAMRAIVKETIEKNKGGVDHQYFEASNGAEALGVLQQNNIDLILLDWSMPKLDGLELVKQVRKIEEYTNIPIIMVTAMTSRYDVMTAIKAGVTDYIMKPIRDVGLWEKIKAYFN